MQAVIVKIVKMCEVKVKETVSDEAREDKWGVRSIDKVQQRGLGRWTSKSDHR